MQLATRRLSETLTIAIKVIFDLELQVQELYLLTLHLIGNCCKNMYNWASVTVVPCACNTCYFNLFVIFFTE